MARTPADVGLAQLHTKLQLEYQDPAVFFWAGMVGQAKYKNIINKWELPGTPIVKFEDLSGKTHGNELRVEMLRKITGGGKTGKQPLVTKEQTNEFLACTLYVHGKREGIEYADWIDAQNVDWMDLVDKSYDQLKMWLSKVISTDPTACIYEGYSRHITEAAPWGLAKTKVYPKNFWIWDDGTDGFTENAPTFSYPDESYTYRDAIITKLLAQADADNMSIDTLYAIPGKARAAKIEPYMINGSPFYVLIINSLQEKDLLAEGTFATIISNADVRGKENQLFKSAKYQFAGLIIYVNDYVARLAYCVSATTLDFFTYSAGVEQVVLATNTDQPYDTQALLAATQDNACAILLGKNAIGWAEGTMPKFTKETRDHESETAVGIRTLYGMAALNYFDSTTITSATDMADPQYAVIATHVK